MFKILNSSKSEIVDCDSSELYQYRVYVGKNKIKTDSKCSYWYIDSSSVYCCTGDGSIIDSNIMCVEIFGYTPENKMSTFRRGTDLPYINGCSTKQLIPVSRPGDPTFQMLLIPSGTSEQSHHIHATSRIVYVLKGQGNSIVGTPNNCVSYPLCEGDIIILSKMIPHHFETKDKDLIVLPLHIFSSIAIEEFNHPMYNGTHRV
jgi:hypothetical protein